MYDDDDEEVEEVVEVYEVPVEEEFYEDVEEEDETPDIFAGKGSADRAMVDQQAKEQDAVKKGKRDKLAALKQSILADRSALAKKERELHTAVQGVEKDEYIKTRERVAHERELADPLPEEAPESRTQQLAAFEDEAKRKDRLRDAELLRKEVAVMRSAIAEKVRSIAMIEQELLHS